MPRKRKRRNRLKPPSTKRSSGDKSISDGGGGTIITSSSSTPPSFLPRRRAAELRERAKLRQRREASANDGINNSNASTGSSSGGHHRQQHRHRYPTPRRDIISGSSPTTSPRNLITGEERTTMADVRKLDERREHHHLTNTPPTSSSTTTMALNKPNHQPNNMTTASPITAQQRRAHMQPERQQDGVGHTTNATTTTTTTTTTSTITTDKSASSEAVSASAVAVAAAVSADDPPPVAPPVGDKVDGGVTETETENDRIAGAAAAAEAAAPTAGTTAAVTPPPHPPHTTTKESSSGSSLGSSSPSVSTDEKVKDKKTKKKNVITSPPQPHAPVINGNKKADSNGRGITEEDDNGLGGTMTTTTTMTQHVDEAKAPSSDDAAAASTTTEEARAWTDAKARATTDGEEEGMKTANNAGRGGADDGADERNDRGGRERRSSSSSSGIGGVVSSSSSASARARAPSPAKARKAVADVDAPSLTRRVEKEDDSVKGTTSTGSNEWNDSSNNNPTDEAPSPPVATGPPSSASSRVDIDHPSLPPPPPPQSPSKPPRVVARQRQRRWPRMLPLQKHGRQRRDHREQHRQEGRRTPEGHGPQPRRGGGFSPTLERRGGRRSPAAASSHVVRSVPSPSPTTLGKDPSAPSRGGRGGGGDDGVVRRSPTDSSPAPETATETTDDGVITPGGVVGAGAGDGDGTPAPASASTSNPPPRPSSSSSSPPDDGDPTPTTPSEGGNESAVPVPEPEAGVTNSSSKTPSSSSPSQVRRRGDDDGKNDNDGGEAEAEAGGDAPASGGGGPSSSKKNHRDEGGGTTTTPPTPREDDDDVRGDEQQQQQEGRRQPPLGRGGKDDDDGDNDAGGVRREADLDHPDPDGGRRRRPPAAGGVSVASTSGVDVDVDVDDEGAAATATAGRKSNADDGEAKDVEGRGRGGGSGGEASVGTVASDGVMSGGVATSAAAPSPPSVPASSRSEEGRADHGGIEDGGGGAGGRDSTATEEAANDDAEATTQHADFGDGTKTRVVVAAPTDAPPPPHPPAAAVAVGGRRSTPPLPSPPADADAPGGGRMPSSPSISPHDDDDGGPRGMLSHDVDDVGVDELPPLQNPSPPPPPPPSLRVANDDDGDEGSDGGPPPREEEHGPPPGRDHPSDPPSPPPPAAVVADDDKGGGSTVAPASPPQPPPQPPAPKKRGRGRPPGSKNKKKKVPSSGEAGGGSAAASAPPPPPPARKRGRPKRGGGGGGKPAASASADQRAAAAAETTTTNGDGGPTTGTGATMNLSCEEVGVEDSEQLAATAASLMAMDDDEEVVAAAALMFFEMSAHDEAALQNDDDRDGDASSPNENDDDGQHHQPPPPTMAPEAEVAAVHEHPPSPPPPSPDDRGEDDDHEEGEGDESSSESSSSDDESSDGGPDPLWLIFYERLKTYRSENGHCRVPAKYPDDPGLGRWVARQRIYRRNTLLADEVGDNGGGGDDSEGGEGGGKVFRTSELIKPDCVRLLDSIGFEWKLPRAKTRRRRAQSQSSAADKESASAERARAATNAANANANAAAKMSAAEAERRSMAAREAELRFQAAKRAAEEASKIGTAAAAASSVVTAAEDGPLVTTKASATATATGGISPPPSSADHGAASAEAISTSSVDDSSERASPSKDSSSKLGGEIMSYSPPTVVDEDANPTDVSHADVSMSGSFADGAAVIEGPERKSPPPGGGARSADGGHVGHDDEADGASTFAAVTAARAASANADQPPPPNETTPTGAAAASGNADDGEEAPVLDDSVPNGDDKSPSSSPGGVDASSCTTTKKRDFRRITFTVTRANHDVPWGITLVPIRKSVVGSPSWNGNGFGGVAVGYAAPPSPLVKGDVIVAIGELGQTIRTTTSSSDNTSSEGGEGNGGPRGDWYLWFKHVGAMFQMHTRLHVEVARKKRTRNRIMGGSSSSVASAAGTAADDDDDDEESMMLEAICAASSGRKQRRRVEVPRLPPMELDRVGEGEAMVGTTTCRDDEQRSIDVAPRTQSQSQEDATRAGGVTSTAGGANSEPTANPEQQGASSAAATGNHSPSANDVKNGEQQRSPQRMHDDRGEEEEEVPSPKGTDLAETAPVMASDRKHASSDQTSAPTFTGPNDGGAMVVSRKRRRSGGGQHERTSVEGDMPPPPPPPGVMLRDDQNKAEEDVSSGTRERVAQCNAQPCARDHPSEEEGTRKVDIDGGTTNDDVASREDDLERKTETTPPQPRTTLPPSDEKEDTRDQPSQTTDAADAASATKYSHLTGKRVAKKFPSGRKGGRKKVYRGTIGGFVPYSGDEKDVDNLDWFLVEYDDGDSEHVAWEDLQDMLHLYDKVGEGAYKKSDRARAITLHCQAGAHAGGSAAEMNQQKISSSPKSTASAPDESNDVTAGAATATREVAEQSSTAKAQQIRNAGPETERLERIDADNVIEEKKSDDRLRGVSEHELEYADDVKPVEEITVSDTCRMEEEHSCFAEGKGGHTEMLEHDRATVEKAAVDGINGATEAEKELNAEVQVEGGDGIPTEKTKEKRKLEEEKMAVESAAEQKRTATLEADEEKQRLDERQRKAEQDRIANVDVKEAERNADKQPEEEEEEALDKTQLSSKHGAEQQRAARSEAKEEMGRMEEMRRNAEQEQNSVLTNEERERTAQMKEMRLEKVRATAKRNAEQAGSVELKGEGKKRRLDEERHKEDDGMTTEHRKDRGGHTGSTTSAAGAENREEANEDHEPLVEACKTIGKTGQESTGEEEEVRIASAKMEKERASMAKDENKEPTVSEIVEKPGASNAKHVRKTELETLNDKETVAEERPDKCKTQREDIAEVKAKGTDLAGAEMASERTLKKSAAERAGTQDKDRNAARTAAEEPRQNIWALDDYSSMIGQHVAKRFSSGDGGKTLKVYRGSIARIESKKDGGILFLIEYIDGDSEHVEWEQLQDMIELFRNLSDECGSAPNNSLVRSSTDRCSEAEKVEGEGRTEKKLETSLSTTMTAQRHEDHKEVVRNGARKTRADVLSSTNCHGGLEFTTEEKNRRLEKGRQKDDERMSNEHRNGKVGRMGSTTARKLAEDRAEAKRGHETSDGTERKALGKAGQQVSGNEERKRSMSAKAEIERAARRDDKNKHPTVAEVVRKRHDADSKSDPMRMTKSKKLKENEMAAVNEAGKHEGKGEEVAREKTNETDAAESVADVGESVAARVSPECEDRASVREAVKDLTGQIGPAYDHLHLIGHPVTRRVPETGEAKKTKVYNGSIARIDNDRDGRILFSIEYLDRDSEQVEWDELQAMMEPCRSLRDKGGSAPHPSPVCAPAHRGNESKGTGKAGKTEKELATSFSSSVGALRNADNSEAVPKGKRKTRATVVSTTNTVENPAGTGRKRQRRPENDYSSFVGRRVAKRFPNGNRSEETEVFRGEVTRVERDEDDRYLFLISYEDGDSEEVDWDELQGMLKLFDEVGDQSLETSGKRASKLVWEGEPPESFLDGQRWPPGWKMQMFQRRDGHRDNYWIPPADSNPSGKKLRSMIEVRRWLLLNAECSSSSRREIAEDERLQTRNSRSGGTVGRELDGVLVPTSTSRAQAVNTETAHGQRVGREKISRQSHLASRMHRKSEEVGLRNGRKPKRDAHSSTEAVGKLAVGSPNEQYAHLVGSPVAKMFPTKDRKKKSKLFTGSVVGVETGEDDTDLFHVKYDDGDSEDVEWDELQEMMRLVEEVPDSGTNEMPQRRTGEDNLLLVGKPVAKKFNSHVYKGFIARVDSGDLFFIKYEDGDSEHVERHELVDMLALYLEVASETEDDDSPLSTRTKARVVARRLPTESTMVSPSPSGSVEQSSDKTGRRETGTFRNVNGENCARSEASIAQGDATQTAGSADGSPRRIEQDASCARSEASIARGGATQTEGSAEGSPRRIEQDASCALTGELASPCSMTRHPVASTSEGERREAAGSRQHITAHTEGRRLTTLLEGSGHNELSDHPEDQTRPLTGQASISSLQETSLDTVGEEPIESSLPCKNENLNTERNTTSAVTSPLTTATRRGRKHWAIVIILLVIVSSALFCHHHRDNHNIIPLHRRSTYSGNKLSRFTDFAALRRGASIIATKTSPSLVDQLPLRNRVMAKLGLRFYGHPPEMSISEARTSDAQGECWAFGMDPASTLLLESTGQHGDEQSTLMAVGRMASLTIKLSEPVRVMSVTIVHPSKDETSNPNSAIREFHVIGYQDAKAEGHPFFLGSFVYDIYSTDSMQEFTISQTPDDAFDVPKMQAITLAMDSNWGHYYSCLYRFQVHGWAD